MLGYFSLPYVGFDSSNTVLVESLVHTAVVIVLRRLMKVTVTMNINITAMHKTPRATTVPVISDTLFMIPLGSDVMIYEVGIVEARDFLFVVMIGPDAVTALEATTVNIVALGVIKIGLRVQE